MVLLIAVIDAIPILFMFLYEWTEFRVVDLRSGEKSRLY
jgi:hypothetical protein